MLQFQIILCIIIGLKTKLQEFFGKSLILLKMMPLNDIFHQPIQMFGTTFLKLETVMSNTNNLIKQESKYALKIGSKTIDSIKQEMSKETLLCFDKNMKSFTSLGLRIIQKSTSVA